MPLAFRTRLEPQSCLMIPTSKNAANLLPSSGDAIVLNVVPFSSYPMDRTGLWLSLYDGALSSDTECTECHGVPSHVTSGTMDRRNTPCDGLHLLVIQPVEAGAGQSLSPSVEFYPSWT